MGGNWAGNGELVNVPRRPKNPDPQTLRPPEPIRPLPAERTGVTLLALRARRRRYRQGLPRRRNG